MKKALGLLILLAILSFLGWQVYQRVNISKKDSTEQRRPHAVAVEVASVQNAAIRDVALFTGTLLPKTYFVVAPKVSGRLEKLLVNLGDRVKRGQLIAVLDDEEYAQQVEQARAELDVAKANVEERRSSLDVAKREYERAQVLRRKKIASQSELDAAQAQYKAQKAKHKVALAQVAQKKAALKAAQVRLSYTRIHVSWEDGNEKRLVGERFVDEGAMLKANAPIVSILEIRSLTAVIHVIERDYSSVRIGQKAVITTDAFPGKTFTGKIVGMAPVLKESSRQARVEIEIGNPDELLKPGMFIRAHIEFARHDNATLVPITALAKRDGHTGVFLVDNTNMKARFVPLTLGIVNGGLAEVVKPSISGLVVTLGQHLLEDGSSITLPDKKPARASRRGTNPKAPRNVGGQRTGGRR